MALLRVSGYIKKEGKDVHLDAIWPTEIAGLSTLQG